MKKLLAKIRKMLKDRRTRQLLTRIISVTAAIVVFITTYALVLPAITMEIEAQCGIPAHQHDDSCYAEELVCGLEETAGHHHTEDCYSTKLELDCSVEEHQHDSECYDADGNLICEIPEHTHSADSGCYEEVRELACEIPESDGHTHDASCYEKVLVCGKEAHTHSEACYSDPAADTAEQAVEISSGAAGTGAAAMSAGAADEASAADAAVTEDNADDAADSGAAVRSEGAEDAATALTTVESAEAGITADGHYVPELAPIDFSTVLNDHTGIYCHAVEDGEVVEDSTRIGFDGWVRIPGSGEHGDKNTELGVNDLLRVYLAYSLPAGALNPTNPVARYRLPSNLHLTDSQVAAINENVNGIAGGYVNMDTLEILDTGKYYAYLGIEAVEGTRTPSDDPDEYLADVARRTGKETNEYISATVRVENVCDEYSGELLAQDLVFTWTPYTIEKNQHEYDSTGNPTRAGEEISGWLTLDFNMSQVDFPDPEITTFEREVEIETGTETDQAVEDQTVESDQTVEEQTADADVNTAAVETVERREQSVDIVFVEEGFDELGNKIQEIYTSLTVVEESVIDIHAVDNDETAMDDQSGEKEDTENPEDTISDGKVVDGTEESDESATGETADAAAADATSVSAKEDHENSADTETPTVIMPAMSFNDSIIVRTGKPADIEENAGGTVANAAETLPEEAEVTVRVEADEGTFPAGTTMKLRAVDNLDDVAKVVTETVENPAASSDTADVTESTDTAESIDAIESTDAAESIDSTESTDSADAVDSAESKTGNKQSTEEALQDQNEKLEEVETEKPEEQQTVKTDDAETEISETPEKQKTSESDENQNSNLKTYGFQAVDITFVDAEGNEIEPAKPVRVALTSATVEQVKKDAETSAVTDPVVVHVDDEGNAKQMELVAPEEIEPAQGKTEEELLEAIEKAEKADKASTADTGNEAQEDQDGIEASSDATVDNDAADESASSDSTDSSSVMPQMTVDTADVTDTAEQSSTTEEAGQSSAVGFTTDSFSVYAIVYTVDFHYDVDGQTYDYSIKGGDTISLKELLPILNVIKDDESTELNEVQTFINDIEDVRFSDESLVKVIHISEDTTAGELREKIREQTGEEPEYSVELTEEDIAEMDAKELRAVDWALMSMRAFDSEEMLTVTMKSGEVFTIVVTDAQISTELAGKTFLIRTNTTPSYAMMAPGFNYLNKGYLSAESSINNSDEHQLWSFEYDNSAGYGNTYRIKSVSENKYIQLESSSNPQSIVLTNNANNATLFYVDEENGLYRISTYPFGQNLSYINFSSYGNNYTLNSQAEVEYDQSHHQQWLVFEEKVNTKTFPVRLHFVKEDGTEISVKYVNGETVDGNNINADYLMIDNGIIDLSQFVADGGYTLSTTHKSTINAMISGRDHSIIGNQLKLLNNGNLQYQFFYTNSDKAGSGWYNVGYMPNDTNNGTGNKSDGGIKDYYLVYSSPLYNKPGMSEQNVEPPNLAPVGKNKQKIDNGDGTYNLELSVSASSQSEQEQNKVNIILILDTSSSMERDKYDLKQGESKWINGEQVSYDASTRRMTLTVNAINNFINKLKPNNTTQNPDAVEMALIPFNAYALADKTIPLTNNLDSIKTAVGQLTTAQGTNWADALRAARDLTVSDNDPTYVLFLTDGAPSQYWKKTEAPSGNLLFVDGGGCYLGAREEARALAATNRYFYGVFSFGTVRPEGDTSNTLYDSDNDYLGQLVDYAYNDEKAKDEYRFYAENGDKLAERLNQLLMIINKNFGHTNVDVKDGIALDTTSTALSNISGPLGTVTYSKTGGTTADYTVKVSSNGEATFEIGGSPYPGVLDSEFVYSKISGSMGVTDITAQNATCTVYKCTVPSGQYAGTYIMPIAQLDINETTKVGNLDWNLSPLGVLENGATYKISFVVWPDQEAYDYVADLNNGKEEWKTLMQTPVYGPDGSTVLYYRGGAPQYPNIVYYPYTGIYAALTNTYQEVTYYIADETIGGPGQGTTYAGQFKVYPDTPDPMPLTASDLQVEKKWNVEMDPGTFVQLLYILNTKFAIDFEVTKDAVPYKTVSLGWDSTLKENGEETGYVWEPDSVKIVDYHGTNYTVGTRWTKDFAIATGLMLSEEEMDRLGLDKSAYPSGLYPPLTEDPDEGNETGDGEGGTGDSGSPDGQDPPVERKRYYVLEYGHDYKIEEPELSFEFDVSSPTYHPMLVDGKMQSVNFTKQYGEDGETVVSIDISKMTSETDGLASLKIENTLRGYINLNKVVVDDKNAPLPSDKTEFEYTVNLTNEVVDPDTGMGPFTGDHIPWYGISGLFYHDHRKIGDFYQVYFDDEHGHLMLKTEYGGPYEAEFLGIYDEGSDSYIMTGENDEPLTFNPNADTQKIQYTDTDDENTVKTVVIDGNRSIASADGKTATAILDITQDQTLNIANVPVGTEYSINESEKTSYKLIKIEKEIKLNEEAEAESNDVFTLDTDEEIIASRTISGTIVANRDNHITYTNKRQYTDINIAKVDEDGKDLAGVIFQLQVRNKPAGSGTDGGSSEHASTGDSGGEDAGGESGDPSGEVPGDSGSNEGGGENNSDEGDPQGEGGDGSEGENSESGGVYQPVYSVEGYKEIMFNSGRMETIEEEDEEGEVHSVTRNVESIPLEEVILHEKTYTSTFTTTSDDEDPAYASGDGLGDNTGGESGDLGSAGSGDPGTGGDPADDPGGSGTGEVSGDEVYQKSIMRLEGLPDGEYRLVELKAPDGYVILVNEIYFKIEEGTVTSTTAADAGTSDKVNLSIEEGKLPLLTVTNEKGVELPNSGGPGTKLIYILGGLLTLAAALLLLYQRKRIRA